MVVAEEQEIEQLAKELLYTHCLEYWAVRFGNARVDLGSCDHRTQTITISRHHIKQHSPEQVRDTILHEIAHAMCRPGEGHGENWKAICRRHRSETRALFRLQTAATSVEGDLRCVRSNVQRNSR